MTNPDELLAIVNRILCHVEEDETALKHWRKTEDGQKVIQFIFQVGKYPTNIGEGKGIAIGDKLDIEVLKEIRDILRSRLAISIPTIDWYQVSRELLREQRLTTNPLTIGEGIAYRTEQVYVPLGLVRREKKTRRGEDILPEEGSSLYRETEGETYELKEFLEKVLWQGQSPNSQGRRIAIIGEPGAGKTTLLQQIAQGILQKTDEAVVIWISLADLRGQELKSYLFETWLTSIVEKFGQARASTQVENAFVAQFNQGRVWLLLDGADEMQVASGDPLSEIERQVRASELLREARIVLTCRLNLWDSNRNALDRFDAYRMLEFSYPWEVEQFIKQWFKSLPEPQVEQGQQLCAVLKEPGKARIRDLIKNPLRLTLLCFNWHLGEGKLPETQAGLYQQFVEDFYTWQQGRYLTNPEQRKQLNAKLGELAREAIDKESIRFRLQHDFVRRFLGEPDDKGSLFYLALILGWLNRVGVDADNPRKPVYAFFHPTFQEYFATLPLNNWHFFINHIPSNPSHPDASYRIFESQWRQMFMLWMGRDNLKKEQKESCIKALIQFEDNCGYFYFYIAYFTALLGIVEFKECSLKNKIINQVTEWANFNINLERLIINEARYILENFYYEESQDTLNKRKMEFFEYINFQVNSEKHEYMAKYLPYHLIEGGSFDEYYELLNDDDFLELILEFGGLNSYEADLELALPRLDDWQYLGFQGEINLDSQYSMKSLSIFVSEKLCNSQDMKLIYKAAIDLQLIVKNKQFPDVVSILKKCFQDETCMAWKFCRRVLWRCAQNMPYLAFYEA